MFFAGVLLLCIPFLGKNRKQVNWHEVIGSNALTAGYIEAFMLLFSTMNTSELMREGLLCEMGLDLRPILYGYILHIVLSRPPVPEKKYAGGKRYGERYRAENLCMGSGKETIRAGECFRFNKGAGECLKA
ncbi:MAG: hypothetical protein ACLU80_02315 [Dorea sp.]